MVDSDVFVQASKICVNFFTGVPDSRWAASSKSCLRASSIRRLCARTEAVAMAAGALYGRKNPRRPHAELGLGTSLNTLLAQYDLSPTMHPAGILARL